MPEMPTLGQPPKQNPLIPVAVTAVVVGLLTGSIFWIRSGRSDAPATEVPAPAAPAAAEPQLAEAAAPQAVPAEPLPAATAPVAAPTAPAPAAAAPSATEKRRLRTFTVKITGPLESAVVSSEGKEVGTALTQVVNRSLVWWMKVPQDLVKGDTLAVAYETRDGQEPLVHAVRYESRKLGKTFESYRFKASGDDFSRFYQADGSQLEERLVDSPIDSYEQITSLLRDGRKHKGVDFKAPVGTPVRATFDGTIVRKNWNFRGNGNSVELKESGGQGRSALYLHLSELPKSLQPGQRVKRGEAFAKSGNSGHSFAPHLHYQLMLNDKPIDPFTSHKATRASLPGSERAAFEKRVAELKGHLPAAELAGN
jgi:murein DD-endopeptidase